MVYVSDSCTLDDYDWRHIPQHIRINSPYYRVSQGSPDQNNRQRYKTKKDGWKYTSQQKRNISNKYDMYKAHRVGLKIVKTKLLEQDITRNEISEKYGISPNTLSASERTKGITREGYFFVKTKQGRNTGRRKNE